MADGGGAVELVNLVSWAPRTPFQISLEAVLRVGNWPWYSSFAVFLLWECRPSVGGGEGGWKVNSAWKMTSCFSLH